MAPKPSPTVPPPRQLPTVSPELPVSAETRSPKGPSVKTSGLAEVTFSQVDGRRLLANAGEGRAGSIPRLAHAPVRAGLRVGGQPRRPEPPGLPLPPHDRPRPSAGSGLSASPPAGRRLRGGRGMGGRRAAPPKPTMGPAGNKASTFTPATLTLPNRPTVGGNKTRRKARAGRASLVPVPNRRTEREGGGGAARAADPRARTRGARGRRGRGRARGRHLPGCNPAPGPRRPPAMAGATGRAGPSRRRRRPRRQRVGRARVPPVSRRARARAAGRASARRRPRRPRAAAAGGGGPRRPTGRCRRPSRRAGRRRRCAGSCCSCSRSPGATPLAPSVSRPWDPEAVRGPVVAAVARAEGKRNPGRGRGAPRTCAARTGG